MRLTNLPHIQYTEHLAECLIDHGHAILPWRKRWVRKYFIAAKLLQYVDEHIPLKKKLKKALCPMCRKKEKKQLHVPKVQPA